MSSANVVVIGVGDGGAADLSAETLALVEGAELLCGGERHLAFFPDLGCERLVIKADVSSLVERLRAASNRVVVLASGDPCVYGIGPILVAQLGSDRVRIIAHLSSFQLAFARLGLAWQDAALLSAHGRPLDSILPAALVARTAAILTDQRNSPGAIAEALLDAGGEDAEAHVFERLGGDKERHIATKLSDLVGMAFDPLNILVIRHHSSPRTWPLGLPEEAFVHQRGQITKAEVRVVALSKLRLHERSVVWDVGAGCGSLAIEAAALARHGRVFAVERDHSQVDCLQENRRRFGAGNLEVVAGAAPAALADLPSPDAIFVGGSGGQLEAILDIGCARLVSGGRIVANFATLQHVSSALAWGQRKSWSYELAQVSVSRGVDLAGLTRLDALNPVFVVALSCARVEGAL